MYKYDLSGKVAVVTGAAKGLGNEYAEVLALKGCDVAIIDIEAELGEEEAARVLLMMSVPGCSGSFVLRILIGMFAAFTGSTASSCRTLAPI